MFIGFVPSLCIRVQSPAFQAAARDPSPPKGRTPNLSSIQNFAGLCNFGSGNFLCAWMPEIFFEIATAGGVELHALSFQHSLLFICRQNYAAGRAAALRIDYALPGRLASISAMHHK